MWGVLTLHRNFRHASHALVRFDLPVEALGSGAEVGAPAVLLERVAFGIRRITSRSYCLTLRNLAEMDLKKWIIYLAGGMANREKVQKAACE